MNLLCDTYPEALTIDGAKVPIRSDFKRSLRVLRAFADKRLTDRDRVYILLRQIYGDLPANLNEAMEKASWFIRGGKELGKESPGDGKQLYSFDKDDRLIFSAFLQTHGVNLRTAKLHWWEFLALFADLGAETGFSQIVHLRYLVKNNLATNDDMARAEQLGDAFRLDDTPETAALNAEEAANVNDFWREWNKDKVN